MSLIRDEADTEVKGSMNGSRRGENRRLRFWRVMMTVACLIYTQHWTVVDRCSYLLFGEPAVATSKV